MSSYDSKAPRQKSMSMGQRVKGARLSVTEEIRVLMVNATVSRNSISYLPRLILD